ncbi:MAG: hypothetical protein ACERKV_05780 [Clostridiaceae bacterium]
MWCCSEICTFYNKAYLYNFLTNVIAETKEEGINEGEDANTEEIFNTVVYPDMFEGEE